MSAALYGVWLAIEGWPCLVVGGGAVATRRVRGLVECGAQVRVVAPDVTAELEQWASDGTIAVQRRSFAADDVSGQRLVIAATSSREINALVCHHARRAGALVNAADDAASGDFHVAATVHRGPIALAVGTAGLSPTAARALRDWLGALLTPDVESAVDLLGEARGRADLVPAVERAASLLAQGNAAEAVQELSKAILQ